MYSPAETEGVLQPGPVPSHLDNHHRCGDISSPADRIQPRHHTGIHPHPSYLQHSLEQPFPLLQVSDNPALHQSRFQSCDRPPPDTEEPCARHIRRSLSLSAIQDFREAPETTPAFLRSDRIHSQPTDVFHYDHQRQESIHSQCAAGLTADNRHGGRFPAPPVPVRSGMFYYLRGVSHAAELPAMEDLQLRHLR